MTVVSVVSDGLGTGLRGTVSAWASCSLFVVIEGCNFVTSGNVGMFGLGGDSNANGGESGASSSNITLGFLLTSLLRGKPGYMGDPLINRLSAELFLASVVFSIISVPA